MPPKAGTETVGERDAPGVESRKKWLKWVADGRSNMLFRSDPWGDKRWIGSQSREEGMRRDREWMRAQKEHMILLKSRPCTKSRAYHRAQPLNLLIPKYIGEERGEGRETKGAAKAGSGLEVGAISGPDG
jgi:hypothetical protein